MSSDFPVKEPKFRDNGIIVEHDKACAVYNSKKAVILQIFWMMFIIQTADAQQFEESISEDVLIEKQLSTVQTWFILYDGEIILELDVAKNIVLNTDIKYVAFNGDFIYNDGFEEETMAQKTIREYENRN